MLHLPVAYQIVSDSASFEAASLAAALALGIGLVGMGLAWCAGCALEQRRRGSVRVVAVLGIVEGGLAFWPALHLNTGEKALLTAAAGLSLIALVRLMKK